jgi:hypothetical protein
MSIEVEVVLRIPQVKDAIKDASGYPINNRDVRFIKRVIVEQLPQVGASVPLTVRGDQEFSGNVTRVDWHDASEMFKVYCQYSQRAIPQQRYLAITQDPDWVMKPLI